MAKKKSTKQLISDKYGGVRVFQWSGYVNDKRELVVVEMIETIAKEIGIGPSFFYTIAAGEGLGYNYISLNYAPKPPHHVMVDKEIDGFKVLGVDDFGSEYRRYKPFLPKDYDEGDEFYKVKKINEHSDTVTSGMFKDLEAALRGFGATLAHRKSLFHRHVARFKYSTPIPDQEAYWIYVYYQGEGRAKRYLKSNGGLDYNKKPPIEMQQIKRLALERLASWRYMQTKKIFSN